MVEWMSPEQTRELHSVIIQLDDQERSFSMYMLAMKFLGRISASCFSMMHSMLLVPWSVSSDSPQTVQCRGLNQRIENAFTQTL